MKAERSQAVLWTIPWVLAACLLCGPAQAKYGGGTGEPNNPYQIARAADLILLGESPDDYDKHFILTADIDLDPNLLDRKLSDKAVIAPDMDETTPSFQGMAFTGVFDGKGRRISHLAIRRDGFLGLFGKIGPGAKLVNMSVADVNVAGSGSYVGALVGYNDGGAIVAGQSIGAIVTGGDYVGGLVGYNFGSIVTSYSAGTVAGVHYVGGLSGYNYYNISMSYSTCAVSGSGHVGGLVGVNSDTITGCYSTGTVHGNEHIGGLVGLNLGTRGKITSITASFWDVEASGEPTSDGGIGRTTGQMLDIHTYLNAGWDFSDEALNGTSDYWRILPGDYPRLRCHVGDRPVMPPGLGTTSSPYLIRSAGDLGTVGSDPVAHYRLDAPVDLSGIRWSVAVVPWFGGTFDGNGHTISNLQIRGSVFLGLFGQLASGAEIANVGLEAVDVNATDDYVGALVSINNGSIVAAYSTGSVAGPGYVGGLVGINYGDVSDSYSTAGTRGDYCVGGLAASNSGSITASYSTGEVFGAAVEVGGLVGACHGRIIASHSTARVTGSGTVGGLAGTCYGSIAESYSTGSVTGSDSVGGLIGGNYDGSIIASYATATVQGIRDVGGLVGYNGGYIATSYSTGTISGTDKVGGLAGWNKGSVATSYSTGTISGTDNVGGFVGYIDRRSAITSSFWDMETSGLAHSEGGDGKTTAEMRTAKTFLDAGWDLVGETTNGTADIWWIDEGSDYPRLWWEATAEPNSSVGGANP